MVFLAPNLAKKRDKEGEEFVGEILMHPRRSFFSELIILLISEIAVSKRSPTHKAA